MNSFVRRSEKTVSMVVPVKEVERGMEVKQGYVWNGERYVWHGNPDGEDGVHSLAGVCYLNAGVLSCMWLQDFTRVGASSV